MTIGKIESLQPLLELLSLVFTNRERGVIVVSASLVQL